MPLMRCNNCGFETNLSRREVEFGMMCPECHGRRLVRPRKERKANRVTTLRAGTMQALVGGVLCLLAGPPVLLWGVANFSGKAAVLGVRAVAVGVVLLLTAVLCFIIGFIGLYKDLK